MEITLDSRLKADTYPLGSMGDSLLLLSRNALFPWFILVPATREIEFHKLGAEQQANAQQHINAIAQFIEGYFSTDKINIATIGNIVSQLHIHIIGRHHSDACWPNVVWGTNQFKAYETDELAAIKSQLGKTLKNIFRAASDAS